MEPVISPWFFYFAGVSNFIMIISLIGLIISLSVIFSILVLKEDKKDLKLSIIAVIAFFVLATFMPSERTCYKMLIASMITPKNVETLVDKTEETIDILIEKIVQTQGR